MQIENFKTDLKKLLANNPQKICFSIRAFGEIETFESKKEFGLRLLELFADKRFGNILLTAAKQKNVLGYAVSDFDWVMRNIPENLESLEFYVNTKKVLEKAKHRELNMNAKALALKEFGTNA